MFESLAMLRKSGVVLLGSVITDAYFQVSGAVALMTLSLLLLAVLQPYKKKASRAGVVRGVNESVEKGRGSWKRTRVRKRAGERASGRAGEWASGRVSVLRRTH